MSNVVNHALSTSSIQQISFSKITGFKGSSTFKIAKERLLQVRLNHTMEAGAVSIQFHKFQEFQNESKTLENAGKLRYDFSEKRSEGGTNHDSTKANRRKGRRFLRNRLPGADPQREGAP
ncbi:MAG TPA: hypothetical protein IAB50_10620 [Candidatus Faecivicinus avistercoris]|nr:hypothetical protein [Candidatus Faecivicinus avistercoris]